jgi:hypothetical protein
MRGRQLERAAGASALLPARGRPANRLTAGSESEEQGQPARSTFTRLLQWNATRRLVPTGRLNLRECRDRSLGAVSSVFRGRPEAAVHHAAGLVVRRERRSQHKSGVRHRLSSQERDIAPERLPGVVPQPANLLLGAPAPLGAALPRRSRRASQSLRAVCSHRLAESRSGSGARSAPGSGCSTPGRARPVGLGVRVLAARRCR